MASAGVICVWIERLSGGGGVCKGVFCFGSSAGAGVTAACCTAAGGGCCVLLRLESAARVGHGEFSFGKGLGSGCGRVVSLYLLLAMPKDHLLMCLLSSDSWYRRERLCNLKSDRF